MYHGILWVVLHLIWIQFCRQKTRKHSRPTYSVDDIRRTDVQRNDSNCVRMLEKGKYAFFGRMLRCGRWRHDASFAAAANVVNFPTQLVLAHAQAYTHGNAMGPPLTIRKIILLCERAEAKHVRELRQQKQYLRFVAYKHNTMRMRCEWKSCSVYSLES